MVLINQVLINLRKKFLFFIDVNCQTVKTSPALSIFLDSHENPIAGVNSTRPGEKTGPGSLLLGAGLFNGCQAESSAP